MSVRLDSGQSEYIEKESAKYGISKSCFVRRIIDFEMKRSREVFLNQKDRLLLKTVSNEINRIGTNVNQIAHGINMGYYSAADKEQLFLYLKKTEQILDKIESIKNGSV